MELRGDRIKVGVAALFAPSGCSFHPFFMKGNPGARQGERGMEAALEVSLSQWVLLALNLFKKTLEIIAG